MSYVERRRKNPVNFHLSSPHYKKIHLSIYIVSLFGISMIYLLSSAILSDVQTRNVIVVIASLAIGVFLVFRRDHIVKETSDWIIESKRRRMKAENKEGLKETLRRIKPVPRNRNLKLNIKGKTSIKDRLKNLKRGMSGEKRKGKKGPDYIEIKD